MKKNEGTVDRILRIVLGIGLLSIAFIGPQSALGYIGIVPLVTGLVGYCPLYQVFGINTCGLKKQKN